MGPPDVITVGVTLFSSYMKDAQLESGAKVWLIRNQESKTILQKREEPLACENENDNMKTWRI